MIPAGVFQTAMLEVWTVDERKAGRQVEHCSMSAPPVSLDAIGWREWVALPGLDVEWIKAKVDTGARSSSLHAFGLTAFERDGTEWVRFSIHPWQRSAAGSIDAEVPVHEWRSVRSSSGESELRPVIRTPLRFGDAMHEIDLTLARRDQMGFRMLVGREAVRRRFVVDPARSYLSGKPPRSVVVANRRRPEGAT